MTISCQIADDPVMIRIFSIALIAFGLMMSVGLLGSAPGKVMAVAGALTGTSMETMKVTDCEHCSAADMAQDACVSFCATFTPLNMADIPDQPRTEGSEESFNDAPVKPLSRAEFPEPHPPKTRS